MFSKEGYIIPEKKLQQYVTDIDVGEMPQGIEWQELTDEDIARLILINEVDGTGDVGLSRLVEHASRIKNHG